MPRNAHLLKKEIFIEKCVLLIIQKEPGFAIENSIFVSIYKYDFLPEKAVDLIFMGNLPLKTTTFH